MPRDPLSRQVILELLQELIRIPSVNPAIAQEEGTGEDRIATFACQWLGEHGVEAWREELEPGRANAIAQVGAEDGPTLVFCAHLDTVGTAGMRIPPFEPRLDGARVHGRGSYDMKGGAAAIMAAAAAIAQDRLDGKLLLALVADEEYASQGATEFVRRYPADGCIVTEPSEGKLILAHKGFVWAEVATRGKAAHGSRWDLGVSAIGKMGRIVAALEEFDQRELRLRTDPLLGPASLHCSLIEGGVGLSTYAPECRLKVERRTLPGESTNLVLDELKTVAMEAGEDAVIECLLARPPLTCDRDATVARAVRDAATEITGEPPEEAGVAYWMDAAIFADAGIPTVNYGAGGEGAHGEREWVDLDSVVISARVLYEAARRFCRRSRPS